MVRQRVPAIPGVKRNERYKRQETMTKQDTISRFKSFDCAQDGSKDGEQSRTITKYLV